MKRILLLFLFAFVACFTHSYAQNIPNNDFETWTQTDTPDNWKVVSGRAERLEYIVNGNDTMRAFSGNSFLALRTDTLLNDPFFYRGIVSNRFAFNLRPEVFRMTVMFRPGSPTVPESPGYSVLLSRWNQVGNRRDTIAFNNSVITASGPNGSIYPWQQVNDSLLYVNSQEPDSAHIFLFSTRAENQLSIETYLYVDSVGFIGRGVGIREVQNKNIERINFYPNPANERALISCTIAKPARVEVKIFDATGKEIQTLYSAQRAEGEHKIDVDLSHLNTGMYFYRVSAAESISTQKFFITR